MPVNRKWPLEELIDTLRSFPLRPGRVIVIEYVLIKEVNDSPEDCKRLVSLLSGLSCKVNLISYNESPLSSFQAPSPEKVRSFADAITSIGKGVLIRQSMGSDIDGACGQLGIKTSSTEKS